MKLGEQSTGYFAALWLRDVRASLRTSLRVALSARLSCLSIRFKTCTSPVVMMAVAFWGRSCAEQGQSAIAGQGGFLKKILSAFFRNLDGSRKGCSSAPTSDPRFVRQPLEHHVHIEEAQAAEELAVVVEPSAAAIASYQHGFAYSAELLANIVMNTPLSAQLLEEIPGASKERAEMLMMAATVFLQIMRTNGWNNDSINSRIALALSISMASKFVMDAPPFGPVYTLSCSLGAGELACTEEQLSQFVFDYEFRMLDSLPIYKCYFNHYSWACEFVTEHALCVDMEKLQNVCLFTAYNATELLALYCSQGEWLVGPAIGVLSIECINQSGLCKCEYSVSTHASDTYQMALDMATVAATADLGRMQRCFGHPFTDSDSLERKSTTQMNLRKAARALARAHAQRLSFGNG